MGRKIYKRIEIEERQTDGRTEALLNIAIVYLDFAKAFDYQHHVAGWPFISNQINQAKHLFF